jgi:hypothetical protein
MKLENRKRRPVLVCGYRRHDPNVRVSVLVEIDAGAFSTKAFQIAEQLGGDKYFWCRVDTRPLVTDRKPHVIYRQRRR